MREQESERKRSERPRRGDRPSWWVPALVFAALGASMVLGAVLHFRGFERDLRRQGARALAAVADVKVGQIVAWRLQLLDDVAAIGHDPVARDEFAALARGDADASAREAVFESLRARVRRLRLGDALILDEAGDALLATGEPRVGPEELAALRDTALAAGPVLRVTSDRPGAAVAAVALRGAASPIFAIVRGELPEALGPLVGAWPTSSRSAQAFLGKRDGAEVRLLAVLRSPEDAAAPGAAVASAHPMALAAGGREGVINARGDRGQPVIAVVRDVPGSDWVLLAKVDAGELLAPARERARALSIGLAALLLAVGFALVTWWRSATAALARRERELEERSLRRWLELLWTHSNDSVVVADVDGCVLEVNDRAVEVYGRPRGELVGRSLATIRAPEAQAAFSRDLAELRARGELRYETVHRRADGTSFPVEVSARVVDEGGRRVLFAIPRDVTDRKRIENLARVQAAFLSHLNDAVVATDREGRITAWTGAAERIYGWTAGEVVGKRWREVLGFDWADGQEDCVRSKIDASGMARFDLAHRRRDGTPVDVEVTATALRREGGDVVGYLAVNRDVTQRRRAEAALRREEERLRLALEVSGVGIGDCDLRTGASYLSPRLSDLLGDVDAGGAAGVFDRLVARAHPEDQPRLRGQVAELLAGRSERLDSEHRVAGDGGTSWHRVSARAVERGSRGEPGRVIVTVADVTRERRLQAQLVFADRLASIGTLAAGVAHEINNPLSYLLGNFEYIEGRLATAPPARQDGDVLEAVREAREGARRIAEIVRGLRTFSRRDPEGAAPSHIDVRSAVRAAVRIAEGQIRPRAALEVELTDVPPVLASEHEIAQVALNLLVNAAQAIPEGRPEANRIRVATRPLAGRVALEVSDSGPGIAPEHVQRIFDPFFTTKPLGEGSGLGLAICHGIVTGLRGEIGVESDPGRGTTFRVLLPPAPAAANEPHREPPPQRRRRGRVLVVDDEALVCRAVARTLGSDHEVVALTEPNEALARLTSGERFDLVLCDLMMPGVTGMDCYEALRATRPELARSMIFLTGGAFTERARAFLERIPNARVEKPFDAAALRALVTQELAG